MPDQRSETKENNEKIASQADLLDITYYTDPLCCWCWAFEPEWQKLLREFAGRIKRRYCMGGLLSGWKNYNDTVNSVSRPLQMGPLWMHVAEETGVSISYNIWVKDPPASSYPACVAVKAAEMQSLDAGEKYLKFVREACMLHGKNIALESVLIETAEMLALHPNVVFDADQFKHDLKSDEALEAFRKDLQEVAYRHTERFPALLIKQLNKPSVLLTGYRRFSEIAEILY